MAEIAYLVAESFNAYADSGAPLRLSGALRERPDPMGRTGAYYYATDQGAVYASTGKAWIVRGALGKDDIAGRASGLSTDMPPAGKMVGWMYHTTDTNRDYEAFPSGWYTTRPVNPFTGPGVAPDSLAVLRTSLSTQYGMRFRASDYPDFDDELDAPPTFMLLQTKGASLGNPLLVEFTQRILEAVDGQFDLVARDAARRSFAGVSDGSTTLSDPSSDPSGKMNWTSEDEGELIKVGRGPGNVYEIQTVVDAETVVIDRAIEESLEGLTLEMKGGNEVTIATKDGFTDGELLGTENTAGTKSRFEDLITHDKIYTVVMTPGATGDGIYFARVNSLSERFGGPRATTYQLGPSEADLQLTPPTRIDFGPGDDPSFNIEPRDMMIGALITLGALAMVGVGVYFLPAVAIAASESPIVAGTTIAGTTTYTVSGVPLYGITLAEAEEVAAGFASGARLSQAVANILTRSLLARSKDTAGLHLAKALGRTIAAVAAINHGNHGGYLGKFFGGGEGAPPGFPGFPGNAPLQPGVRCYIPTVNGTPDGSPPICFFED